MSCKDYEEGDYNLNLDLLTQVVLIMSFVF